MKFLFHGSVVHLNLTGEDCQYFCRSEISRILNFASNLKMKKHAIKDSSRSDLAPSFTFINYAIVQFIWILMTNIPLLIFLFFKRIFSTQGKNLNGQIVLITGTGRGLGKALAFEFAKCGCKIICVDINKSWNDKTVQEINKKNGNSNTAVSMICDLGNLDSIKKLTEEVYKKYENIDLLVSNAGIVYGRPITDENEDMVKKVVNVNLMSSYWLVKMFLPKMKEQNSGHLVFINSIASLAPLGEATVYTLSKYGLLGLTDALYDEFNRKSEFSNLKISSVHPFFIGTEGLNGIKIIPKHIMMKTETAAKIIVRGVRREYVKFTVPGYDIGTWLFTVSRTVPIQIYQKFLNKIHQEVFSKQ